MNAKAAKPTAGLGSLPQTETAQIWAEVRPRIPQSIEGSALRFIPKALIGTPLEIGTGPTVVDARDVKALPEMVARACCAHAECPMEGVVLEDTIEKLRRMSLVDLLELLNRYAVAHKLQRNFEMFGPVWRPQFSFYPAIFDEAPCGRYLLGAKLGSGEIAAVTTPVPGWLDPLKLAVSLARLWPMGGSHLKTVIPLVAARRLEFQKVGVEIWAAGPSRYDVAVSRELP